MNRAQRRKLGVRGRPPLPSMLTLLRLEAQSRTSAKRGEPDEAEVMAAAQRLRDMGMVLPR